MSNLVPFDFHGDRIDVVREGSQVFVPVKRVCENLGISHRAQLIVLRGKPWARVSLIDTPSPGGMQKSACVDLDVLPMWLASIEPAKVKEPLRAKLVSYQVECSRVLRDHFFGVPRLAVHRREIVLDFAHGVRVGDDIEYRDELKELCSAASKATGRTVSAVHGVLRSRFKVPGVYFLSLFLWDEAKSFLSRMILGGWRNFPRRLSSGPISNLRQTSLFGAS